MHVFLRRSGKVIGSFDRLDYLAQLDQGGIRPDDEWTPVGEETWRFSKGSDRFRAIAVRSGLTPYCSGDSGEVGGSHYRCGVEAGGVFAVPVVATAVEDDGRNTGPSDEVEDVLVPGGEVAVVQPHLAKMVILIRIGLFNSSGYLAEPVFSSGHREAG